MSTFVAVAIAVAVTLSPILPVMLARATQIPISAEQYVSATVFNSGGPCQEDVHLTGNVQLVTDVRRVKGAVEITVFITLDGHGVGALTGAQYLATGAVRKDVATQELPASIQIQAMFAFVPLGACQLPRPQAEHLTVDLVLEFDAAGNLAPTSFSILHDDLFGS